MSGDEKAPSCVMPSAVILVWCLCYDKSGQALHGIMYSQSKDTRGSDGYPLGEFMLISFDDIYRIVYAKAIIIRVGGKSNSLCKQTLNYFHQITAAMANWNSL